MELVLGLDHRHGRTGQHVTRPYENGVANAVSECLGLGHASELSPLRLLDTDAIKDFRELGPILGFVDVLEYG